MNTSKTLGMTAIVALLGGCATADLRSESLRSSGVQAANADRGRQLLRAMSQQHGIDAWKTKKTTEVQMRDDWDSALAAVLGLKPWDEADLLRFRIENGTFNIRTDFIEGDRRGELLGIQAWQTYAQKSDGKLAFEDNDDTKFFLPAVTYFQELAFRLVSAPVVAYEREAVFAGRRYDKVFVGWGDAQPNNHDQYVVWINQATGLMDLATFTIREQGKFFQSTIYYDKVRDVQGVKVAFRQTVADFGEDYADNYLHQMRLASVSFDAFSAAELHPNQELDFVGDAKP